MQFDVVFFAVGCVPNDSNFVSVLYQFCISIVLAMSIWNRVAKELLGVTPKDTIQFTQQHHTTNVHSFAARPGLAVTYFCSIRVHVCVRDQCSTKFYYK